MKKGDSTLDLARDPPCYLRSDPWNSSHRSSSPPVCLEQSTSKFAPHPPLSVLYLVYRVRKIL